MLITFLVYLYLTNAISATISSGFHFIAEGVVRIYLHNTSYQTWPHPLNGLVITYTLALFLSVPFTVSDKKVLTIMPQKTASEAKALRHFSQVTSSLVNSPYLPTKTLKTC